MAKKGTNTLVNNTYRFVVRVISHDAFFWAIVALTILQGLWYAFSFQPTIFDEGRHLSTIYIYANHWNPFMTSQPTAWDHLGEIIRGGSYMFYFVMSLPLRLARLFTSDHMAQVISMRIVCVAFFAGGIVLYRKALLQIENASKSLIHLSLLFLILTPAIAILPGAVNYDNLVFLLFALLLYLSVKAVKSKDISLATLACVLIVGLFMSVVKWASAPLFAPIVLYLCYDLYQKHGRKVFSRSAQAAKKLSWWQILLLGAGLVITFGLFIERPVVNVIKYGKAEPACDKVIGVARCQAFPDYVIYSKLSATKPAGFTPRDPVQYVLTLWEPRMLDTAVNSLEKGHASEFAITRVLYSFFAVTGVVVVLLYLRDFLKNKYYQFLIFISAAYLLVLTATEYLSYVHNGLVTATRTRYLLPILPIFIYFVALAFYRLFGKFKLLTLLALLGVLMLFTQGGSIVTYSLTTPNNLYWQTTENKTINTDIQNVLHPFVVEHIGIGDI